MPGTAEIAAYTRATRTAIHPWRSNFKAVLVRLRHSSACNFGRARPNHQRRIVGSIFTALLVIGALSWLWRDSLAARELAVRVCRRSCESEGLQFLDDTVALASMHPVFPHGRPRLRRVYSFDFSRDGDDRQCGTVILTGTHLDTLYIPDRAGESDSANSGRGVVIDLDDTKHRQ